MSSFSHRFALPSSRSRRCLVGDVRLLTMLAFVVLATIAPQTSSARAPLDDQWPSWRGPGYDGTVAAPGQFPESFGLRVLWKYEVGSGYSGVSIANDRVLTMYNRGASDFLGAFDATTGALVWQHRIGKKYKAHDGGHDGPASTPVADDDTAYALSADGLLVAVDLDSGSLRWSASLVEQLNARVPYWGFATTPIVAGDLLIVQTGGRRGRALAGFDKRTGDVRWTHGDGTVDYRSPVLANINGRPQLIVSTGSQTSGVDPATGDSQWTYQRGIDNDKTPLYLGNRRVLLIRGSGCELIQVPQSGNRATSLWRSNELDGNYDIPVHYEGYLYGFSGRYLTCVDVASGRRQWRSRPPGGKGVICVDGHLVIFGSKGDVVVVEATPEGYREKARLNVSDAAGYSWPSYAKGTIYVRNLRDLVAVTTAPSATEIVAAPPTNQLETFLTRLENAKNSSAIVDDFMNSQTSFPIVEDQRLVHFVYRGPASDVGISGTMIASGEEDELFRAEGTDFFYRTYEIEPGARFEYRFNIDFGRTGPDPRNPRRAPGNRSLSEVVTDGWSGPVFAHAFEGVGGKMDSVSLAGGNAQVYLPHGYDTGAQRYPLVLVTNGPEWLNNGNLPNTLNHLGSQGVAPIVVFVPNSAGRELGGDGTRTYARRLAEQVVPAIDQRYRTRAQPASRTILGHRGAAVAAVFTALEYPKVFGSCAAISYGRADTVRADLISERIDSAADIKPRFYLAWNRYEIWRPQSFDCREQSRDLTRELEDHGFEVTARERLDSTGWTSWREQAGEAILGLLNDR